MRLGQRRQVVIPKEICDELNLQEGDFVEVTSAQGKVIIKPKELVDREEALTPDEKARIDASIGEGLEDFKQGRFIGPFKSAKAAVRALKRATS
jgi:AbrB family looped-hinge helix DNA binding protein